MGLAILVQHRGLGIVAHASNPEFVDDHAAVLDAIGMPALRLRLADKSSARRLHNRAESFLHVLRHLDFIVAPVPVEAQHRDAPLIDDVGIEIAIAVLIRNHLASTAKSDVSAIAAAAALLEGRSEAFEFFADCVELAPPGHAAAAIEFNVVPAEKFILAV